MRAISLALLALAASPLAQADELLAALQSKQFESPTVAFDVEFQFDGQTIMAEVDPTKPEGERMVVTSPDESAWPEGLADALESMDKNARGAIWCDEFVEALPDDAERVSEGDGSVTYAFTPKPEPGADGSERKLFEKLTATMVVDAGTVTVKSYQLHLPEPIKPHFLAKIETFALFVDCVPHDSGNSRFNRFDLEISGSAMGNNFDQTDKRRVANLRPAAFPDEG
ncbi:MAG: hypothetical protein AAFY10_01640 [Pseudomonadota bacterium]